MINLCKKLTNKKIEIDKAFVCLIDFLVLENRKIEEQYGFIVKRQW